MCWRENSGNSECVERYIDDYDKHQRGEYRPLDLVFGESAPAKHTMKRISAAAHYKAEYGYGQP